MDWALIESWKEMGVPLHVALRGIEQSFDSYEAKPRKRSVKTLLYCQEEVEAQYQEWLGSHVGASSNESEDQPMSREANSEMPFSREAVLSHLKRAIDSLEQLENLRKLVIEDDFCDTLKRVVTRLKELKLDFENAVRPGVERLEDSLTSLEKLLDDALLVSLEPEQMAVARAETQSQLKSYRSRMDAAIYKQTLDNLLLKRMREQYGIPRLSLFFL